MGEAAKDRRRLSVNCPLAMFAKTACIVGQENQSMSVTF
jgi:hypothetical protein